MATYDEHGQTLQSRPGFGKWRRRESPGADRCSHHHKSNHYNKINNDDNNHHDNYYHYNDYNHNKHDNKHYNYYNFQRTNNDNSSPCKSVRRISTWLQGS